MAKKMMLFSLMFCVLPLVWANAGTQIQKEWQICQSDNDCTAGVVCCGCWESINKKYIKKLVAVYNKCSGACDASCRPQNQPVIMCVNNLCKAIWEEKRTDKTMEQWVNENIKSHH